MILWGISLIYSIETVKTWILNIENETKHILIFVSSIGSLYVVKQLAKLYDRNIKTTKKIFLSEQTFNL